MAVLQQEMPCGRCDLLKITNRGLPYRLPLELITAVEPEITICHLIPTCWTSRYCDLIRHRVWQISKWFPVNGARSIRCTCVESVTISLPRKSMQRWHFVTRVTQSFFKLRSSRLRCFHPQCEVTSRWRWRQHGSPKRWYPTTTLHGFRTQRPQISQQSLIFLNISILSYTHKKY